MEPSQRGRCCAGIKEIPVVTRRGTNNGLGSGDKSRNSGAIKEDMHRDFEKVRGEGIFKNRTKIRRMISSTHCNMHRISHYLGLD